MEKEPCPLLASLVGVDCSPLGSFLPELPFSLLLMKGAPAWKGSSSHWSPAMQAEPPVSYSSSPTFVVEITYMNVKNQ